MRTRDGGRYFVAGMRFGMHAAPRPLLLPIVLLVALLPSTAHGQSILDRVVGKDGQQTLVLTQLTGQAVGQLAGAAGVPIGLEAASIAPVPAWTVVATGRTLREVADAIVAADSRYDWREDGGVLVFRPRTAWDGPASALDEPIGALQFDDIEASDALRLIGRFFGVNRPVNAGPGDTRRFSIDVPAGTTRLGALNAIVRAHGTLTWVLSHSTGSGARDFPFTISLIMASSGMGLGIPRGAEHRTSSDDSGAISRPPPARGDQRPLLDRIVGTQRDGRPLRANGISGSSLSQLAAAVGIPMGVQMLLPDLPRVNYPGFEGYVVTGMPLRSALELLEGLDARYEWREMDGVIVFRPVTAWNDPNDPLFRLLPSVQFHDVPTSKAIGGLISLLGGPDSAAFPDTRTVSVDVPSGSMLELLNAFVRAHGELTWEWAEFATRDIRMRGGRHSLTWYRFAGSGSGWSLP